MATRAEYLQSIIYFVSKIQEHPHADDTDLEVLKQVDNLLDGVVDHLDFVGEEMENTLADLLDPRSE